MAVAAGSEDTDALRAEGTLEGLIAASPCGTDGFGYDPIFVPEGETATLAVLGAAWKLKGSHRARAARVLLPLLDHW